MTTMKARLSLIFLAAITLTSQAAERPAPAVTLVEAQMQILEATYSTTGVLKAHQSIDLRAEVGGKITEIHVTPTARVSDNQLLVELDTRTLLNQLEQLRIDLRLAKQQLSRLQTLVSNRSATREAVDVAEAEVASLNAEIAAVELTLEDYEIRAPFAGILGNFDWVNEGWVSAGTHFTSLDDVNVLDVQFDLPERFLSQIALGQPVTLTSPAWPDEQFDAQISMIDPRMDEDRSTLSVEAQVSNQSGKLRPGMRVKVALQSGTPSASLVIPVRSLMHDREQTQVYLVDEDSTARLQHVTTGTTTEDWVEITSGLELGDRVIDRGIVKARANKPVRILEAGGQDS